MVIDAVTEDLSAEIMMETGVDQETAVMIAQEIVDEVMDEDIIETAEAIVAETSMDM